MRQLTLVFYLLSSFSQVLGQQTKDEIEFNRKHKIMQKVTWAVALKNDTITNDRVKLFEEFYNVNGELIKYKELLPYGHYQERCWIELKYIYSIPKVRVINKNVNLDCKASYDSTYFEYDRNGNLIMEIVFDRGRTYTKSRLVYDDKNRLKERIEILGDSVYAKSRRYEYFQGDSVLVREINLKNGNQWLASVQYYDTVGRRFKACSLYPNGNKIGCGLYRYDTEGKHVETLILSGTGEESRKEIYTYEFYH